MSNDSIIQISADATGVERGVRQAQSSLNNLANTAQQAGNQASGSLNRVGDAATRSAQSQERASRSIERTLQREIALLQAGERGSRAYYESLAQQRGADMSRLTPMLNQLDSLRQRTDGLTISQGQYNAALRMMPAQMTDIVTQLAGGQSPFLIAIQQGGQMRDSFGGFGNMFRGIAASISPFKLAVGGAVGAVGALGYAMYAGAKEGREFENVLTLSGNRAGITADRLQAVADTVGSTTGSFSAAREAVMAFAAEGKIAQDDYGQFATSVSLMSQATGKDVADLVAEFTKIGDDPVKAVVELSGKYKSMTADVYAQVTALKEQGKEQEAVRLVQKLYADETAEMAKKVTENLGWIEKAWKGIGETASETWEKMKSLGKAQTIEQQIKALEAEKQELLSGGDYGAFGATADYSKQIAQIDQKISMLKQEQRAEEELTEQKRVRQLNNERDVKFLSKVGKMADDALPKMEKLNREIAEIQEGLAKFKANPENSKAAIAQAEKDAKAAIKAKQAEKNDILTRERKAAEREERAATRGSRSRWATTSDGLRLKAGAEYAGKSHGGTYAMAHALQSMLGTDLVRFGAFRDKYHMGKNSSHNTGLAFDATPNARMTRAQMAAVPEKIKAYLANLGFSEKDFFVQFEHAGKRNKNGTVSTGNHWHFNWRSKEAAAKFASLNDGSAKAFAKAGLYKEFDPPKAAKKSDFEKYQEQATAKQLRAQIERELRAKGEHRVIENERDLRSRPEFKNWTKEQQNSELAKARAADELATQEKIKSLADAQIAQLTQKQALIGKNTELARLQYELDSGSLKHLSDGQKSEILTRYQAIEAAQKQYETDKKYGDLLDSLAQKTNEQFNQKAFELSLLGKSKSEIEKLTLAREYDLHIMQATADGASAEYIDGLRQQQIAAEEVRQKIAELQTMSDNNWLAGVQDGVTEYIGNFKTMREGISSLVSQTANGFTDQIAEFVATGKANFREFSQSVIADISKMMIKMAIFNSLKAAGNAMSGSGWVGAIGSMMSNAFSDGGYTGHGGKFEPAGIVHKGEYVLSQENLRALGGVQAVESLIHRAKGYSNGGLVGGGAGVLAHARQAAAPVINITVNVSGNNREEARQGAEEGVQVGLRKMMSEIADSRIFEHCRPGNVIYNVAKA